MGNNSSGQLGDGTTVDNRVPVRILTGKIAIAAGELHSLALDIDGTVWAWGSNSYGQLGVDRMVVVTSSSSPRQVSRLPHVAAVSAGLGHNLAVKHDRTVWAWGLNDRFQLRIGSTGDKSLPSGFGRRRHGAAGRPCGDQCRRDGGFVNLSVAMGGMTSALVQAMTAR